MDRVWSVVHKEDRGVIEEAVNRARRTGVYYSEFRILRADGTTRWVAARARYIREAGDELLVGVNLDVTDKKLAEDALVKSEKIAAVGRLASSISHEINNPLEAVTNLLFLAETTSSFDEARTYVKSAQHELQRVTEIVTQTLRFHRQSTKARQTRLSELIGSVLALYQNKITHGRIQLQTTYCDDLPVLCFEGEIRQVLANIVGNAIDAMPSGGMLLVRLHRALMKSGEPGMRVTVADSGAGMSAHTRRHLFEPFYTTKGVTGTGLGLWVSHEIVRKHQGSIRVKSSRSSLEHGSAFCVFLPSQTAL
jgi:signal transduction histidine kinase